jgi:prepilin-type N-terminal cleavage/methylation domain-containing protein
MKKGFTFIEILVAVSILALLALLLANILPRAFDIYNTKLEEEERFSNVQIIFDRLAREIRQGSQVIDISQSTQTLGYLTLNLSSGGTVAYSYTLYNGKYYFTVDNEIQAGPIKELRFVGLDSSGTYTTLTSNIRTLSITVVMENDKRYASTISLRAETPPAITGIFITEIMYYPARYDKNGALRSDERDMEFIVIYNGTTYTINLEKWQINGTTRISEVVIGDFNLPPGKYAIIGGTNSQLNNGYFLPSDYYYLRTQQKGLYKGNLELPNNNGTITLEDNRGNIIDSVSYSYTWGGYPSGTRYYSLLRKSIAGSSNDPNNWMSNPNLNYSVTVGGTTYYSYCLRPRILITEIMYYPAPYDKNRFYRGERNMEFIEIYNTSSESVNIQNWSINGNRFATLVSGSWNLPPGGYAIIGGSGSTLNTSYNLPPTYTYIRTQTSGLGGGKSTLPNTSGSVILRDASNNIVDQVSYSYTWGGHRVYIPDPPNHYYYHYSLEKKDPSGPSQDPNNWGSSNLLNYYVMRIIRRFYHHFYSYCTPGSKNSISP